MGSGDSDSAAAISVESHAWGVPRSSARGAPEGQRDHHKATRPSNPKEATRPPAPGDQETGRTSSPKGSNHYQTLAATRFVAAKQLKSGDLSLKARSAAEAETLRHYAEAWVKRFGKNAGVNVPRWGIVAYGIYVQSMDLNDLPGTIQRLQAEMPTPGASNPI